MPELPEVETVRRVIEPQIVGRRIEHVRIYNEQVIAHPGCGATLQKDTLAGRSCVFCPRCQQ